MHATTSGRSTTPRSPSAVGSSPPSASVAALDGAIPRPPTIDPITAAAAALAVVLACCPFTSGYYAFTAWAPLSLGTIVLLVVLALVVRPRLSRHGLVASLGLMLLLTLSFASILWAESRDSAWTSANQLVLYVTVFAIGVLAIRARRSAQVVMLILGLPALLTSLVLAITLAAGGGGSSYLLGRLDQPIGYINGTAGLLAMGIWPWLAIGQTGRTRAARILAMGGAGLIAAVAVTTQARALVPGFFVAAMLVMAAIPGRTRRALQLAIVAAGIAVSAHWTLTIYSSTGPAQQYMPPASVLRDAGLAIIGAGLLAASLTGALEWLAARMSRDRRERISRWLGRSLLAMGLAAALAIGGIAHNTLSTQWNDFTHLNPEQSAPNRFVAIGSGFRYDLWRVALKEFEADPLVGVGAGNYDDSYYRLRKNPQSVTVPHSLELQMLAELGIGGIIALLLFCGGVLWAGVSPPAGTLAEANPGLRIAALGMFSAWLIETSFDWLYDIPGLTGMAILAAATLVVRDPGETPHMKQDGHALRLVANPGRAAAGSRRFGPRAAAIAALALLAALAASLGRQYVATLYSNSGQSLASKSPLLALRTLRTAEQLDPWSMQTQYAVASAYARLNDYSAARTVLLHAEQLEPENYVPPALLGDIATRAGDDVTALAAYRRALRLDPREPALKQAIQQAEERH